MHGAAAYHHVYKAARILKEAITPHATFSSARAHGHENIDDDDDDDDGQTNKERNMRLLYG